MTELGNLERNLRRLSGDLARVQKPVDRTHAAVKGTKSVLAKPRQLSLAMKRLSSKARSLRYTALFLIPFPVIGTLALLTVSHIVRIGNDLNATVPFSINQVFN